MSVKISGRFLGGKKVELTHEDSGAKIVTDAPKDNQGEGQSFSPTDMVTGALGACMMTIMAIVGERHGLDLAGMRMDIEKHMGEGPRRIAFIPLAFHLPAALAEADRALLEKAARACPVHHSLHPDVQEKIEFIYDI